MTHEEYMALALAEAEQCAATGDVPVGCVIVRNDTVIGRGHNRREAEHSALGHAEIMAIREACRTLDAWRLADCTLYVTLEPCPMCAGAIYNARIPRVVFGARDREAGAMGGCFDLFYEALPFRPAVIAGVREHECAALLRKFFEAMR